MFRSGVFHFIHTQFSLTHSCAGLIDRPAMRTSFSILVCVASTLAAPSLAVPQDTSSVEPKSGKVLVLDNDRTIEGDIDRLDDQYRVRRTVGITWVPADRVLKLCKDKPEALAFLRQHANLQDPDERLRLARWCHL